MTHADPNASFTNTLWHKMQVLRGKVYPRSAFGPLRWSRAMIDGIHLVVSLRIGSEVVR